MKLVSLSSLKVSRMAYGCWRIAGTWDPAKVTTVAQAAGRKAILAAYDAGFTLFDQADIYCHGETEKILGQVLKSNRSLRKNIVLATKCGIRMAGVPTKDAPYRYDFSADYIIRSCEQSLKRLGVETIDLYQLHRPDYLMDPSEVASAFSRLKKSGKVREFGVSNFRPSQVSALQSACPMKLVVNQVEVSLANLDRFEDGTLDQCLAEGITPMAWSPLAGGIIADGATKVLPSQEAYRKKAKAIKTAVARVAKAHGATPVAVALAWLLRHPSGIIPIVGSTQPENIRAAAQAPEVSLSREEWYQLLLAARGERLP
jgi:predicted oxidoreductase